MPQAFKSVETIEGDGVPGSIRKITFGEASPQYKYLKHRIDTLDKENMKYSCKLIEGGPLMDQIESISYEIKFEAYPDGGCKGTYVSKYTFKAGIEISEEEIKAGKAKAKAMAAFKAVEAYLLANPDVYA